MGGRQLSEPPTAVPAALRAELAECRAEVAAVVPMIDRCVSLYASVVAAGLEPLPDEPTIPEFNEAWAAAMATGADELRSQFEALAGRLAPAVGGA